jgi:hypothetical protein
MLGSIPEITMAGLVGHLCHLGNPLSGCWRTRTFYPESYTPFSYTEKKMDVPYLMGIVNDKTTTNQPIHLSAAVQLYAGASWSWQKDQGWRGLRWGRRVASQARRVAANPRPLLRQVPAPV